MSSFLKKMAEKYFRPVQLKGDVIKMRVLEGLSGGSPNILYLSLQVEWQDADMQVAIQEGTRIRHLDFRTSGQTEQEVADNFIQILQNLDKKEGSS